MSDKTEGLEEVGCPLGCPSNDVFLFSGRDRLSGLPGEFRVVKCCSCGLSRTNPRPTPQGIGVYYPDHYGPYAGTLVRAQEPVKRGAIGRMLRAIFRTLVQFNTEAIPELNPGRMFEVGCASGAFLARMRARGWQVSGLEFSDHAAAQARAAGLDVQTGTLESTAGEDNSYDLVVGWMVLEHLHDPLAGLSQLLQMTKPGGWLCVSVPNAGSCEFSLFKGAWYSLHLPNHLYHFNPRTLRALLEKAGWRVERILHQRNLGDIVGSLGHWLEDQGVPAYMHRPFQRYPETAGIRGALLLYPLAWTLSLFGQTGRMTVWARKPTAGA